MVQTLFSSKLFVCFISFFFLCLFFVWYRFLCLLILLNFLRLYEIRCSNSLFLVLNGCPIERVPLGSPGVLSDFGGIAQSDISICHISPQNLVDATMVGCRAGDGRARI